MTRTLLAAVGASVFATAVLSAQTPPPAPPTLFPPATAAPAITLTGCVKPWDASTMGTATRPVVGEGAVADAAAPQYVLTNVEHTAKTPGTTPPGAPMPPASGAPAAGAHQTYLLKPQSALVDLKSHLNHKVEVTGAVAMDAANWFRLPGTPAPGTPAATGGTATSAPRSATPTTPTDRTPPAGMPGQATFVVSSITMIAKTCP